MNYISTRNITEEFSFIEAVTKGIADDGGLFVPKHIPKLNENFWENFEKQSFKETAYEILRYFIDHDEIELDGIVEEAFNFPVEIKKLNENIYSLELFHGPSLAFKDFGARFLASVLSRYAVKNRTKYTILVATSGDTGSAVGQAFLNKENIEVKLLYPAGKVSELQEKQLTTIGGNVTALEIDGTFDDCQRLVKQAFADGELRRRKNLTSANSINIARLLPQILYYFEAVKKIGREGEIILSVPSGNLGNLCGALIGIKMGLPVHRVISALNVNDVFNEYMSTGKFTPRRAVPTLSNAMDVGAPNNLERIIHLFDNDIDLIRKLIKTTSISDEQTLETIRKIKDEFNYVICPHTAVGFASLFKEVTDINEKKCVVASTAHPAKFYNIYPEEIKRVIKIPEQLKISMEKEKQSVKLSSGFDVFKSYLLG